VFAAVQAATNEHEQLAIRRSGVELPLLLRHPGDNGTFWSVVQKGQKQAGIRSRRAGQTTRAATTTDGQGARFISAAVIKPDGLVASRPTASRCSTAPTGRRRWRSGLELRTNCGTPPAGRDTSPTPEPSRGVGQPVGGPSLSRAFVEGGWRHQSCLHHHEATSTSLRDRAPAPRQLGATRRTSSSTTPVKRVVATATFAGRAQPPTRRSTRSSRSPRRRQDIVEAAVRRELKAKIATLTQHRVVAGHPAGKIDFRDRPAAVPEGYLADRV